MMVGQMSRWSIYEGSTEATEPGWSQEGLVWVDGNWV